MGRVMPGAVNKRNQASNSCAGMPMAQGGCAESLSPRVPPAQGWVNRAPGDTGS
jgi:hypothetical protein